MTLLRKLKRHIMYLKIYIYGWLCVIFKGRKRTVFIMGTPLHGNLGDQAITISEEKLLNLELKMSIVEIPSILVIDYIDKWKHLIGDSQVLIQGGGFIGSLWPEEDKRVRCIFEAFSENYITILPQTIYFKSMQQVHEYRRLFNKNKKIVLCVREELSYRLAKEKYGFPNVELFPDMVTYLSGSDFNTKLSRKRYISSKNDTVLFCFRQDRERVRGGSLEKAIVKSVSKKRVVYADTIINKTVTRRSRRREVLKKLEEFMSADIVVTDRLHGMMFSVIAGTPCLALDNRSKKISGVYKWISNNDFVKFVDDSCEVDNALKELLKKSKSVQKYDNKHLKSNFKRLAKIIGDRNVI